jgi:hypothetical protein
MTYSRKAFQCARRDIRDLLSTPVQAWMLVSPARRTDAMYRDLLTVPLDLAAAGYAVTVSQTEHGWCIEMRRDLMDGYELALHCEARSWAACLWQLAEDAGGAIDDLQHKARRESERKEAA